MSRIHEALKKAAEDRGRLGARQHVPKVVEAIHRGTLPSAIRMVNETIPATRSTKESSELSFAEVVERCTHTDWKSAAELDVSRWGDSGKVGAEGFRTLRSRLYQVSGMRPLRKVLITSTLPGEGKTFVAINLALSIVRQPDKRVLLIDADLRVGGGHEVLGASNSRGLSDYLQGTSDEFEVIQKDAGSNLCFISKGSHVSNPSELLLGDRMKTLLDRMTPAFDWVILDSPPILAVHDPSCLADLCDGVVMVVRAGATSEDGARKAAAEFRDKHLIGVVLNQVDPGEMEDTYGNYCDKYLVQ
jgi:protein-tyrosine kinase